jgi:hypothetical protein
MVALIVIIISSRLGWQGAAVARAVESYKDL